LGSNEALAAARKSFELGDFTRRKEAVGQLRYRSRKGADPHSNPNPKRLMDEFVLMTVATAGHKKTPRRDSSGGFSISFRNDRRLRFLKSVA
jgi:hypothetical protein